MDQWSVTFNFLHQHNEYAIIIILNIYFLIKQYFKTTVY